MKTSMIILMLMGSIVSAASLFGTAEDPLNGNYVIGNSAEIICLYPGTANKDTCYARIFDYDGGLVPSGLHTYTGIGALRELKMLDVTSGDYNGDGKDDIVMAYFAPDMYAGNKFNLMIPSITSSGTIDWSTSTNFTDCCLYMGSVLFLDYANIRLITGNFDDDYKKEFALAFWNFYGNTITIKIYEADNLSNPQMVASIAGEYANPELEDAVAFDIAAGDFDGDGIDEIILAGTEFLSWSDWRVYSRIYQVDLESGTITPKAKEYLYQYDPPSTTNGDGDFIERMVVATGNFDNDLEDEAVVGFQHRNGQWRSECIWPQKRYDTYTSFFLQPIYVAKDLNSITFDTNKRIQHSTGWINLRGCTSSPYYVYVSGSAMSLETGDLDTDGRDEIVWGYHDHIRMYTVGNDLQLTQKVDFIKVRKWLDPSVHTIRIADVDVNPDDQIWLPEIIFQDWGASGYLRLSVYEPTLDEYYKFNGIASKTIYNTNIPFEGQVAIATGDFNGDGVRLGPPNYFQVDSVSQPIVVLNSPPVHYDTFNDSIFDLSGCFDGTGPCNFYSIYSKTQQIGIEIEEEVKTDWGIGAKVSCSTGYMGASIEASFTANYGQNFSKVQGNAHTLTISDSITTKVKDMILATRASYEIWEYPIYFTSEGVHDTDYFVIAKPQFINATWTSTDELVLSQGYIPGHEIGNILSYPKHSDSAAFANDPDVGTVIKCISGWTIPDASGTQKDFGLNFSDITNTEIQEGWNLNLGFDVKVGGYGMEVGVNGKYNRGEVSTHKTRLGNTQSMYGQLGSYKEILADAPYTVTPCVYRATNDALVLDYGVLPVCSGIIDRWWDQKYSDFPDFTFIRPKKHSSNPMLKRFTPEITVVPSIADPLETVTITAVIHNYSLMSSTDYIKIQFYMNDPENPVQLLYDTHGRSTFAIDGGIAKRDKESLQMQWMIPPHAPKDVYIYAVIDPDDEIAEVHENNNVGWAFLSVPNGSSTDVEDWDNGILPDSYVLLQNNPNPFNPMTTILYSLPEKANVELTVYNILGRKVKILVEEFKPAGYYSVQWDGTDYNGHSVASGVYFYRLAAGEFRDSKKMVMLK